VKLFGGLKEKIELSVIGRILEKVDAKGSAQWPVGWIKFKRALVGWKFLVGWVFAVTPDILNWMTSTFPGIMHGAGLDPYTAQVVKGVGTVLMIVGAIHKWLKFIEPLERRSEEREDEQAAAVPIAAAEVPKVLFHEFTPVEPAQLHGEEPVAPKPEPLPEPTIVAPDLSPLESEVFLQELNKRVNNAMPMEQARQEALNSVLKARAHKSEAVVDTDQTRPA
jgi:hypothetical protein